MIELVTNDDVELAVERRGEGPRRLLFAHGWISSRRMWYDVADQLDPARFSCYLLDFRGAGVSDRPMAGHDLAGYASDLRAVLAAVGPAVVVAHSMGAKVAQFVASERNVAIDKLILVAPGSARAYREAPKQRALAEEAFGSRKRIERFQRGAMTRMPPPAAMERIVEDALIAQREHWFGWYEHGRAAEFVDRLERIDVPTLVVAGETDPLAPPSRVRRDVVEPIAGALFVNLRNAGHNLPVEIPEELAAIVERFAAG